MRSLGIFFKLFLIVSLCTSCNHFSINGTEAIILDAEERLVLATHHAGKNNNSFKFCAEPSPDVMGKVATSVAMEGNSLLTNTNLGLGISFNETLALLGKRTSTIQLLRDALYRACEAHINGALTDSQYKELLYGYDDLVLTLLAIESITQTYTESHVTRETENKHKSTEDSPLVMVDSHSTKTPVTKEVAEEIRKILGKYYELQKFIYKDCHVESYRCVEMKEMTDKNPSRKAPTYSQEAKEFTPVDENTKRN